jgi:kumamolisin
MAASMIASPSAPRLALVAAQLALAACDPPKLVAVDVPSGLQRATSSAYEHNGVSNAGDGIRAIVALPIRDVPALDQTIAAIYDPASPSFRAYLTRDEWMARHAPLPEDLDAAAAWLEREGMRVARVAKNRLLLQLDGTVAQFNATFDTELRDYTKADDRGFHTYGHHRDLRAPPEIGALLASVVVADRPADTRPLPVETGNIVNDPPEPTRLTVPVVARAYGLDPLAAQGFRGQGTALGVVVGAGFKFKDIQSFWRSQGITRPDPELVVTMEPLATRFTETTLDVEWAGGIAPGAELIVYAGPDAHDTSLVYTFNEAIGDARVSVITDSFAHREDATTRVIRRQYDASARMAAALGITLIAAGGDSGRPDVPGSSPLVTSVGGTILEVDASGHRLDERAWVLSGSGDSLTFDAPAWQAGLPIAGKRAVSDVGLAGGSRFWVYVFGEWQAYAGTSFSAPVFAGLIAVVNSARAAAGKPPVGFLNSILYTDAALQATFFDVVAGGTAQHPARPGWDYPTGWGAPNAAAFAATMP